MHLFTRTLFCFLFILGSSLMAVSQAVITYGNFPRGTDFTDYLFRSQPGAVTTPAEGPEQVWDYSGLVLDQILSLDFTDATQDPVLPGALNSSERNLSFQVFPIPSRFYEGIDEEGWYGYGRTTADVNYSITAISGGPNDILRFPATAMPFEGRINSLQFPVTYGKSWSESMTEVLPYELTVAAFGLQNTPGEYRRPIHQERQVVGYGQMILPREDGSPTLPMEVLMIKVVRTAVDSYYLGGAPAPVPLMAAFGLTQGQTTVDSFCLFYMPGFGAPVFDYSYNSDVAFYRPYAEATVSVDRPILQTVLHSYPNPVASGSMLHVVLETPAPHGQYQVWDALGRLADASAFTAVDPYTIQLPVPGSLHAGMYVFQIFDPKGEVIGIVRQMIE